MRARIHTKVPFSNVNRGHSCLFSGLGNRERRRWQRQLVKTGPRRLLATTLGVCDALAVRCPSRQHGRASSEQWTRHTRVQKSAFDYRMSRRHEYPCEDKREQPLRFTTAVAHTRTNTCTCFQFSEVLPKNTRAHTPNNTNTV